MNKYDPFVILGAALFAGGYMMGMYASVPYIEKQVSKRWRGIPALTIGTAASSMWPIGVPILYLTSRHQ